MSVMTMLAVVIDEVAGNRGSVRNCHEEICRRRRDEEAVDALVARIPATDDDITATLGPTARPASA